MSTVEVTKDNFQSEVINSDKPVLVDFWAAWCGPCRMVAPILEEIATENPDIKVAKVNVDEQQELAAQFGIMSIPTIIAFKDGKQHGKSIGVRSKQDLVKLVK
ncbi:MAG: thioredoxin [Christensenellales bacterium]|jgi:thioredoxin 1|nr:thioredoxin [Christensenellaceae bacterium]